MPYRMGDLAAVDSYDPFAAEQFVNPAVDAIGRGLAQTVMAPGQLMQPNPYQPGGAQAGDPYASELASWYDDQRDKGAVDWGRDTAMQMAGPGLAVGAPVKAGEAILGAGPIRAYHGSPHDFDRFDLSKIGTGEGAQAYGHGLYFAENEGVAKSYRDALAGKTQLKTDNGIIDVNEMSDPALKIAGNAIKDSSSPEHARMLVKSFARVNKEYGPAALKEFERLQSINAKPNPGNMYEVNINADPAHFLDWDKPLAGHPEKVREALSNTLEEAPFRRLPRDRVLENALEGIPGHSTGESFYRHLSDRGGSNLQPLATERLLMNDVPGIKYLDQGSRGAGQGSSNYVVFNDKLIDIMRKYGLAGLAPAGMGALAAQDQYGGQ